MLWERTKELFHEAAALDADERRAFLARVCKGDEVLLRDLESLLAAEASTSDFLGAPPMPLVSPTPPADAATQRTIGLYHTIAEIGRGGMGTVYLAIRADDVYQRRVAIKLVRRGMDTDDILQRFRQERHTLARLDHPNIARIVDGGTTEDGLPYLVMDYVDGVPIDDYCDHERLTIDARLDLFRTVCSAVHYAHQNLVVHRDLKPDNILVTRDGEPKLLDFGVAKVLTGDENDDSGEVTRPLDRRMTLRYASPEQVQGLPITTAADEYSLGVLLYELLSGYRPYETGGVSSEAVASAICELEPSSPSERLRAGKGAGDEERAELGAIAAARSTTVSGLARRLAGDLDRIVAVAMRKEPLRRYKSVEQLAEDLHRHLRGLPVTARADTVGYRGMKFVRRHRVGVAAAGLAGLALAGGILSTLWQARQTERERRVAERRFGEVRELANSVIFEIHDAIADLPGSTAARELLVRRAVKYVDNLAAEAASDPLLQLDLATAYQRIGDVQGNPTNANLGDIAAAHESYRKAMSIAESLNAVSPNDSGARRLLARLYQRSADLRAFSGDPAGAVDVSRRALALYTREHAAFPEDGNLRLSTAISHIKLGDFLGNPDFPNAGDPASALGQYAEAKPLVETLPEALANSRARYLGLVHERLGRIRETQGELAEALDLYRISLEHRSRFAGLQPTHTDARRDLAIAHEKIANILRATNEPAAALQSYLTARGIFESLLAADPRNANAIRTLAISREHVADVLAETGDLGSAHREYLAALDLATSVIERAPANIQAQRDRLRLFRHLGDLSRQRAEGLSTPAAAARRAEACGWYEKGLRAEPEGGGGQTALAAERERLREALKDCAQ